MGCVATQGRCTACSDGTLSWHPSLTRHPMPSGCRRRAARRPAAEPEAPPPSIQHPGCCCPPRYAFYMLQLTVCQVALTQIQAKDCTDCLTAASEVRVCVWPCSWPLRRPNGGFSIVEYQMLRMLQDRVSNGAVSKLGLFPALSNTLGNLRTPALTSMSV